MTVQNQVRTQYVRGGACQNIHLSKAGAGNAPLMD